MTASLLSETKASAMAAPVAPEADLASPPSGQVSVEFPSEAFPVAARVPSETSRPPASAKPHLEAEGTPGAPSGSTEAAPARAPRVEVEDGPQYLYGVVRAAGNLDFGLIGLGAPPADVRAVREGDLAALVSTSPALVVDPTRSHLLVHQRVTEAILHEHTLLPVAFGTVLRSEAQVRALLRTAHGSLSSALAALEGKVELGLKVIYHREHLARRLELEDAQLSRHDGEPEADHERRLGAAVEVRAAQDMASLLEGLRPLAQASRTSPPVGDRMLLNAAFLVERQAVPAFEAKVKSLAARSDIYSFRFTGPWAPYSFVDVRLGLEPEPDTAA
ncbi:GvpL/GvpF family gas vesicle protein [Pyxidicoccus trucidator]|uniref:GvpL/GvpF family gas vesicle protein n=1 Tax=Pyxidicoccus trucidator TaxID=2709662 RepID=UPI001F074A22|nr:GvpL/GvpF family gas vesicle protein [Pyxidicoccus trucidator]